MTTPATHDSVYTTIQNIIATVAKIPPSAVAPENPVTGLANVDSIMLLEIVARTEIALDIEVDEEQLFTISTVGDFVATCEQLAAKATAPEGR